MDVSSDGMDEKYEDIEESLENLLIFPTRKGLRRSFEMIEAYFIIEVEIMQQLGISEQKHQSILEDQEIIVNIAKDELSIHKQKGASNACESCWIQAPKAIDKGIGKNVAARLASAFARHADKFRDIIICTDGKK